MQDARELNSGARLYIAVGLLAGAVIALQIAVMRIFAAGNWAHFGSFIVSIAMLGVGISSTVMCVRQPWFERHWRTVASAALLAFGPIAVAANLLAQQYPFNAIFLIADDSQKWRLAGNFVLYLLPFFTGSLFLGTVFLKTRREFARIYFADLAGCGLCGLATLGGMWLYPPEHLLLIPLMLWLAAGIAWAAAIASRGVLLGLLVAGALAWSGQTWVADSLGLTRLAVSEYKGVSYAQRFPDAKRVYARATPFGHLEIYASSYLHFAPGLSDNAALNLPQMPDNAYLGLYIDGDGPIGIIRDLPPSQTAYFDYLPTALPFALKKDADVFVVQFGGGLSTAGALNKGARSVTVADSNPAVLRAFREDEGLREFTGDILAKPRVKVVDQDGRIFLSNTAERYDVVDLSLADSAGLSNPGGFAIAEKYNYTTEAMQTYMRALDEGGVLAVTLWNKEEPPKSVLRLYATMVAAAREMGEQDIERCFYVVSSYLSTSTVLYRRGGFSDAEIATLKARTRALSFDEIQAPGNRVDAHAADREMAAYRAQIFGKLPASGDASLPDENTGGGEPGAGEGADDMGAEGGAAPAVMPSIALARAAWAALLADTWQPFADTYVYDLHALTNQRPYFAAYLRPASLPGVLDRLDLLQDEWGYLLVWATLIIACCAGAILIALPALFGWRGLLARCPGKAGTLLYFACLGAGYIMVEVVLISHFILALSNATVSATVLITGMLVFSGLGSLCAERYLDAARRVMPWVFIAIALLLIGYGLFIDRALEVVGALPYAWRLPACFLLILPPAFLMGMPLPTGMTWLARLGKEQMFLWAWGVNGCMSVIGAALVPLLATSFGLSSALVLAGLLYLVALPAFRALLRPLLPADA
ncbi:MAG: hypothetical protein IPM80_17425 [Proteobacteria bacterium]|nr:hypothetical protein [Pseudomonadota bacterium]MBK8960139.1 hypothetical protein [Pseudomonadota bacterium]